MTASRSTVHQLVPSDPINDAKVMAKYLHTMLLKFAQIELSVEMLLDITTLVEMLLDITTLWRSVIMLPRSTASGISCTSCASMSCAWSTSGAAQ